MSYSPLRGFTGPANVLPPLRCERLEDRSLLSVGTLFILQDLGEGFVEELPPGEECETGIVVEVGTAIESPVDEEFAWEEGEFAFNDSEYWDAWYYEEGFQDEEWVPEEEFFDDTWYTEEEYLDETWVEEDYYDETWYEKDYSDETWVEEDYYDETWYGEDDSDETWVEEDYYDETWVEEDYYDETWYDEDSDWVVIQPMPTPRGENTDGDEWVWQNDGEWSWPTGGDDEMVYLAMTSAGGIPVADASAATAVFEAAPVEIEPVNEPIFLMPPGETALRTSALPAIAIPESEEDGSDPVLLAPGKSDTSGESAGLSAVEPLMRSDDHLEESGSLELSEDLPVG